MIDDDQRDCSDAVAKTCKKQERDSPRDSPEGTNPADTLIYLPETLFGLVDSRTVRECIWVVLS